MFTFPTSRAELPLLVARKYYTERGWYSIVLDNTSTITLTHFSWEGHMSTWLFFVECEEVLGNENHVKNQKHY
ncbi:hypothetical protein HanHA300_Chr04g0124411 [Helianthus annuus]|nr:hypothetical protein HanHA300_Chr04g0124411 [Helianthus annuus]KAJ0595931.1 hypothetical protein HanHA89_Chr04g0136951 [Helianthus annuus]